MEKIIGHKDIIGFFAKVKENNNFSHAYCFSGPKNVGKLTVAKFLAASLLNVSFEKIFTSPDFYLLQQSIKEKTGKLAKDINMEQVRAMISFLSNHAFLGGYKVAIIDGADLLNNSASNSLLKTLEEPSQKTVIFLITDDEKKLLPTILSRCQLINFSLVGEENIKETLLNVDLPTEKVDYIAKYSCGLPGITVKLMSDEDYYNKHQQEVKRFETLFAKLFYEKLAIVEELFGDKTDHIQARNNLLEVLNIWQMLLHLMIKENRINRNAFLNIYRSLEQAK
ncbi:MAG: hypothetical protein ACD_18C00312G0001, partial [uncultured bacterium]